MSANVETKMRKSNVSFTTTFTGFSGYPAQVGVYTSSPHVELDDRIWSLRIYPGGYDEESKGFLSCFVAYESHGYARASFKLSIVNQKGWKNHCYTSDGVKSFVCSFDPMENQAWGEAKFVSKADLGNKANGYVVDDKLVIKVEMTVYGDIEQSVHTAHPPCIGSPSKARSMVDEMSSILFDDTISDITIKVEEELIPAHKFILCLRSEVFRAMLRSPMKESVSNVIEISDFEAVVVREFLHFIYTDTCSPKAMDTHAEQLLAMACKYQVKGLETLCENHLCSTLTVDNIVNVLLLADMYSARHLKNRALLFISHNAKAVIQSDGFFDNIGFALCQEVMKAVVGAQDDKQHPTPSGVNNGNVCILNEL